MKVLVLKVKFENPDDLEVFKSSLEALVVKTEFNLGIELEDYTTLEVQDDETS